MASDPVKAYAIQQSQHPNNNDTKLDEALQSLLIDDAELKRILKGEVHDELNKLRQMMVYIQQRAPLLLEYFDSNKQEQNKQMLSQLLSQFTEVEKQIGSIFSELKKYKRYIPYLLLFTSTSVLSNIERKEALSLFRKMDIMVTRDELDCQDDEDILEDKNFFDAIRIRLYLHIFRNVEGWTFKGLVEEKRTVQNLIRDDTGQPRKKRLFGLL